MDATQSHGKTEEFHWRLASVLSSPTRFDLREKYPATRRAQDLVDFSCPFFGCFASCSRKLRASTMCLSMSREMRLISYLSRRETEPLRVRGGWEVLLAAVASASSLWRDGRRCLGAAAAARVSKGWTRRPGVARWCHAQAAAFVSAISSPARTLLLRLISDFDHVAALQVLSRSQLQKMEITDS